MDNFCQFWNKVNGEPYTDGVPSPSEYKIQDMGFGGNGHELTPLSDEDIARHSDEDVRADMEAKKAAGFNPCKLGGEMSDEDFDKFHGRR